jgi:uncharacterized protein (DUF2141 family)
MRYAVLLSVSIVLLCIKTPGAADMPALHDQTGSIAVRLTGFENDRHTVKLCVCRSEDECAGTEKGYRTAAAAIRDKKAVWVFEDMPYGTYSIKAFHDENGNNRLDTNVLGKPTERYGFSNNARGCYGPPSFSATAFTLNAVETAIEICLQ